MGFGNHFNLVGTLAAVRMVGLWGLGVKADFLGGEIVAIMKHLDST